MSGIKLLLKPSFYETFTCAMFMFIGSIFEMNLTKVVDTLFCVCLLQSALTLSLYSLVMQGMSSFEVFCAIMTMDE